MTARILLIAFIAACVLGGHLSAVLLFAVAFIVVSVHLFPLLAMIAVVGTALVLLERVTVTAWRTGWRCIPIARARAAW
jgi:hypothetical protein